MKLLLTPESSSYNLTLPEESLRSELDGGRGRYRLDIIGGSIKLEGIQFRLDPTQYQYFCSFYRRQMKYASEPFEMDLLVDNGDSYELCTCNMIPGTLRLVQQSGLTYIISFDVEVTRPFDSGEASADDAIITAFNADHDYTP